MRQKTDKIVAIGIRLGKAMRREADLDARSSAAGRAGKLSAEIYLSNAAKHVTDETYALRDALSLLKATSLTGAAIHIVEALILTDRVWDQFPDDHETAQIRRDMRSIERLLYSALNVVESLADRRVEDIVTPGYVSRHCDPWIPVEERCEQLKAGTTS